MNHWPLSRKGPNYPAASPKLRIATLLLLGVTASCQMPPQPAESAAALLRLQLLEGALRNNSGNLLQANKGAVRGIQAQVAKNHNQPADLAVFEQARAVRDSTQVLVEYLGKLREELRGQVRGQSQLAQLAARRPVAEYMQSPARRADELQRRLRRHAGFLTQVSSPARPGAAASAQVQLAFDFAETSLAGALAAFAQCEAAVLLREHETLTALSTRVGPDDLNKVFRPVVSAETRIVAPGQLYQARLTLLPVLYKPGVLRMSVNGQAIPVGADGTGLVTFTVPALGAAASRRAHWDGAVAVHLNGRDTTFRVRVPYTVVRRK